MGISKKGNTPFLVSKDEMLIRMSIMFSETPTLHISDFLAVPSQYTRKSNEVFMIVFTLIFMVGKGPRYFPKVSPHVGPAYLHII